MEKNIHLDVSHAVEYINMEELTNIQKEIKAAQRLLYSKTGPGHEFLGWIDLPRDYDKEEYVRIQIAAKQIRKQAKVLIVIGIGGSYLGTKTVIDSLSPYFEKKKKLEIIYAGQNMSSTYLADLIDYVNNKEFAINVISKSGTTTEPAIAFRLLKKVLETKYGVDEAKNRIYVTTDKAKGAFRTLANEKGYKSFVVPDDIGGRYSVLTAVGLLPIAVAGINIKQLLQGAEFARKQFKKTNQAQNDVLQYVAYRNLLYRKGYSIEMLVNYEPKLSTFSEWWKQLFGESEGKDEKGLFVSSATFSTDLHSLGQFIQEGKKILFETVIQIDYPERELTIESDKNNLDGLNYISGKTIGEVNKQAYFGTLYAHEEGNVPNIIINIPELNAFNLGSLIYFFELACGISGYVLGVNPFDQPGVEAYKKNMFALLGKPGYEKLKTNLLSKQKQNG